MKNLILATMILGSLTATTASAKVFIFGKGKGFIENLHKKQSCHYGNNKLTLICKD